MPTHRNPVKEPLWGKGPAQETREGARGIFRRSAGAANDAPGALER